MNANFIKTSDEETAKKLEESGYTLVNYDAPFWTFLNDSKMTFESQKLNYTNNINI